MSEWLARRVIAYAHQGGSFEGPSSTLATIEHALEVGASGIELDVHATKDRQLVVCHDATIDRTTNHRGAIADMTLAELRQVDNAYWWIDGDVVSPGRPDEEYQCGAARRWTPATGSPPSPTWRVPFLECC